MSRRSGRTIKLPAPYLRRVWLDPSQVHDREAYPFCLPIFPDDFELTFEAAITIIVGENGTGKSTILEGIAALAMTACRAAAFLSLVSRTRRSA